MELEEQHWRWQRRSVLRRRKERNHQINLLTRLPIPNPTETLLTGIRPEVHGKRTADGFGWKARPPVGHKGVSRHRMYGNHTKHRGCGMPPKTAPLYERAELERKPQQNPTVRRKKAEHRQKTNRQNTSSNFGRGKGNSPHELPAETHERRACHNHGSSPDDVDPDAYE